MIDIIPGIENGPNARDARWITDIFKHNLVSGSLIPPSDIRQLRDLMRYRVKLTSIFTGEKEPCTELPDRFQH
jgi:hypothetical protein